MILSDKDVKDIIKLGAVKVKYVKRYGEDIFKKCYTCNGTGLVVHHTSEGPVWDCFSYCSECAGTGGTLKLGGLLFKCDKCNSYAEKGKKCQKCGSLGYVDWFENLLNKYLVDG